MARSCTHFQWRLIPGVSRHSRVQAALLSFQPASLGTLRLCSKLGLKLVAVVGTVRFNRDDKGAVNENFQPVDFFHMEEHTANRVALHHYVSKSLEDYKVPGDLKAPTAL